MKRWLNPCQRSRLTRAGGFTLIEMMVVIAISAILLVISVPSMRSLIERNAISSQVNTFIGSVALARSEAIKRNAPVVMCRSENADTSNSPSCAGSGDWKTGWIVFMTHGSSSTFTPASGDVLLRVQGEFRDSGGISQSQFKRIQFRNSGILGSGNSGFTFSSKSLDPAQQRQVCISATGRTRLVEGAANTC